MISLRTLQPLDRSVFKPLKVFNYAATNYMHSTPEGAINKFIFGELFSTVWSKAVTVGNGVKGFKCTGLFPLNPLAILEEKFLPSVHFQPEASSVPSCSVSENSQLSQLNPESPSSGSSCAVQQKTSFQYNHSESSKKNVQKEVKKVT